MPPDINSSGIDFTPTENSILFGLSAIRNLGSGAIHKLIESRVSEGPFTSLADLCDRIPASVLNRRAIEPLIHCGALDSFHEESNRAQLTSDLDLILDWASSRARDRASGQGNLFNLAIGTSEGSNKSDLLSAPKGKTVNEYPPSERLKLEKELMFQIDMSY